MVFLHPCQLGRWGQESHQQGINGMIRGKGMSVEVGVPVKCFYKLPVCGEPCGGPRPLSVFMRNI